MAGVDRYRACDGIVSPAYFVFDFRIANHEFGQRLLRSKPYVAHFGQASDGVRVGKWDLSIAGMRQIPVLVPSENEQAAIVHFLDHANRKIDGFIRAKRKLIGLLNEQKQAIIYRAITRDRRYRDRQAGRARSRRQAARSDHRSRWRSHH
jgi:type I restriction enzyme S subunit